MRRAAQTPVVSRPTSCNRDTDGRAACPSRARPRRAVSRRRVLAALAASAAAVPASARAMRLFNPCLDAELPAALASHEIVARAFDGIDPAKVIDAHVHLLGVGGGPDSAWIGDQMLRMSNPLQYARYRFFLNASCVPSDAEPNRAFLDRLLACHRATLPGSRLLLLAFDQVYDAEGHARTGDDGVPRSERLRPRGPRNATPASWSGPRPCIRTAPTPWRRWMRRSQAARWR